MAVTAIDQQFDPCIFEFKLRFSVGTIDIPIITQLSFLRNCSENCSDKLPELRKTSIVGSGVRSWSAEYSAIH